jgi:hypothetical protein
MIRLLIDADLDLVVPRGRVPVSIPSREILGGISWLVTSSVCVC